MRFIGSKEQLLPFIEEALRRLVGDKPVCIGDLFCGTASVSRLFKKLGHKVVANDNLKLGYVLAQSVLTINDEPEFSRLVEAGEIPLTTSGTLHSFPYDRVLAYLNSLPSQEGFFHREYSPDGIEGRKFGRRYFSAENAAKIDALRAKISEWCICGLVTEAESCLLLSDLMRAVNRVANIAGTYGYFMKDWDNRARKPIQLLRSIITPSICEHEIFCADANEVVRERHFDVIYLDPPYTWRHYGAYYHILETIAHQDEPQVKGRTGLRPWRESKSAYCDRSGAVDALRDIIRFAQTTHLLLSYSEDGLISHEQILEALSSRGDAICMELPYRRYQSNNGGSKRSIVKERLYYVQTETKTSERFVDVRIETKASERFARKSAVLAEYK